MVVNVFAEGGILGGNDDASTIANSEALREEFFTTSNCPKSGHSE